MLNKIVICMVITLLLAGSFALAADAGGNVLDIPLSSLDISKTRQSYGAPRAVTSAADVPLLIGGRKFYNGLQTHAKSLLWIDLKSQAVRFTAMVGSDDKVGKGKGAIEFRIIGDDKLLFKSPVMSGGRAPVPVDISLQGYKTLQLLVVDARGSIDFGFADWADAKFEVIGDKPEAIEPYKDEAVILTPRPSPEPRINGARVFGVRPGHPFLYRIAATGNRPMTFSATGLPNGLILNPETGIITGSVAEQGTYVVKLTARNTLGTATRELKIIVGDNLALTPPMGWNDWYSFGRSVTARDIRAAADAMISTGLADHGYTYVNIDDCWMVKKDSQDPEIGGPTRDAEGNILSNKQFGDLKALTDYIHSKGLKAGIYTSPGPKTCAGYEGSYQHEKQDAEQFAKWGFDFLKYDMCSYRSLMKVNSPEEQKRPYVLMGDLIKKQDRDIVFNLCQYGVANVWEWGKEVGGHCWRTAGDIGSNPADYSVGFTLNGFEKWVGPGGWNDPDYINIGILHNAPTLLTPNEQYTYVTLWSMLAAPLIFSGDLTKLDDFTLSLLSNDEVIDVNQDPLGKQAHRVAQNDGTEVWVKDMEDGSKAVGLFNRSEIPMKVAARWSDLGVTGKQRIRDLWRQRDIGVFSDSHEVTVPRHGATLLRLWAQK